LWIIIKTVRYKIAVCVALSIILLGSFSYVMPSVEAAETTRPTIVYFYISVCDQCHTAEKALDQMNSVFKENGRELPAVKMYNLEDSLYYNLMNQYFEVYNVPKKNQQLPILFVGKNYYVGETQITAGLKDLVSKSTFENTPLLTIDIGSKNSAESKFSSFTAVNVFFVALVNGFNPCSMSILLFFLSLLLSKKVNVLKMGLSFVAGKFIMYLLLGTVLFGMLNRLHGSWYYIVNKLVLLLFIFIIVILNVNDFFAAKKEEYGRIKNQLPQKLRKFNHDNINRFVNISNGRTIIIISFLLGLIISVGEFLCTGQMYLATIAMVARSESMLSWRAFVYLIIYVTVFILPLIAIVILVWRGRETFELSETVRARLPLIKLVSAFLFLVIGIFVILKY